MLLWLPLLLSVTLLQSTHAADPLPIPPHALRPHVEFLARPELEGRGTRKGKQLAAHYLQQTFESLKLKPLFNTSYRQPVPGPRNDQGQKTWIGENLGALLPGSDPALAHEVLVVGAHYDHLGRRGTTLFPGADDNASGVAMLLEVARALASRPAPPRSIAFVAFDLEEHLLWGSTWFVAHPPVPLENIRLMIAADMIGRSLGDLPLNNIFVVGAERGTGLRQIVRDTPPPAGLTVSQLGADLVGTRSDYGPFRDQKIPFLFFSGGEHPDYHTPNDTPDRIEWDKAARVASFILALTQTLARADQLPTWSAAPPADLDEVRTLFTVTSLLLDRDQQAREAGQPGLTPLQRTLVERVHSRAAHFVARNEFPPSERPWLIRSAQLLLVSVF